MEEPRSAAKKMPEILLVTGDPDLAAFMTEGLVLENIWTSIIGSGFQTLEVFRIRSFDLAFIDADLGDLSATELVRRLRGTSDRMTTDRPPVTIPIFVIAAAPGTVDPQEVLDAGATGLLTPPLEIEDLVSLVRTSVDTNTEDPE